MALPSRRATVTEEVGPFSFSVGFVEDKPVEVFITGRGKTGTALDEWLYELGVRISKTMQHED